ncbi:peptidase domain-containing ABC transporter [Pedobacter sp. WC2423]|uniref:peptidase domain-containing ABC transporter n=1 Tax=Pedobacter sp. WC2423 TaxID=3234142 RepID=UPI0034665871
MSFPFYKQFDLMDCGPTCLRMVAKHYGRSFKVQTLRQYCEINREGVSLLGIHNAASKIGFDSDAIITSLKGLEETQLPVILHWRQNHFVVLYKIKNNKYFIVDPGNGHVKLNAEDFSRNWIDKDGPDEGIALTLTPTPEFYAHENETGSEVRWSFLLGYFMTYRKLVIQLFFGLAAGSILQLIAPFLTQSIVDVGINTRNLNFIYVILIAQGALIIGRISVDFIRSWILLHISIRVNISILTDFIIKLMKLPMVFFDTKMTGDIMQRMNDQKKIETFLTGTALTTLFSIFNLLIFSVVIAYYNMTIFFVFLISSSLYMGWIVLFLNRRKLLNYKSFEISAKNQSNVVQLVTGMQEIKLNNCEQQKRWEWEDIQASLFNVNVKNLALSQYQQGGSTLINEGKNLLIAFLSARAVIDGNMTLGAMVAVQYIIGQLNGPIEQMLGFIQGFQDARISLERLNEIYQMDDEEQHDKEWNDTLPVQKDISIEQLSFRYPGTGNMPVLRNIDLKIPQGKTTAIVGMSGSGKTTILKLLLRFYQPDEGEINIGNESLNSISYKAWRDECGVVMQDGFIFSDTIERNIAVGEIPADPVKLNHAIKVANIQDFIDGLPRGLNTMIGAEGNGVSQGQLQRMLIARAVYKDPEYIFFDEATNSLDANNEWTIMNNLKEFFTGRTVIIVAHRLSTVRDADNIIVLDKGRIIEQGTHQELSQLKGAYYLLVKNQLELGT